MGPSNDCSWYRLFNKVVRDSKAINVSCAHLGLHCGLESFEMADVEIVKARSERDLNDIIALFTAYTSWLNIDLTFQDFASEFANLPGKYALPTGELLLARRRSSGEPLGCIALRALQLPTSTDGHRICELKRLYVVPGARGTGAGKALVTNALGIARKIGYAEARLDTLPHMQSAIKLYEMFGFVECERYYETPLAGTRFMLVDLRALEEIAS